MDESDPGSIILKILSGVQAGVDVALADGEYTLGSDDDDDIQIFDVSLKAGHARLRIGGGTIEIAGGAGQLTTKNGLMFAPGGARQTVEPLDVVTAGTTRFALGARSANWASVTEERAGGTPESGSDSARKSDHAGLYARLKQNRWRVAAAAMVVLLVSAAGLPFVGGDRKESSVSAESMEVQLKRVEAAVATLPFSHDMDVRQEVDGAIYVTGYVEKPVERRAVVNAVRDTGVPARVRVPVLEQIRNETANLLQAEKADLTFKLSDRGILTLKGVMFDDKRANAVMDLVRQRVNGLAGVVSQVRTGPSLLEDVQSLAEKSKILPWVRLRFDGGLIEASGIIPKEKIDAWAGFLQAYSTDFSDIVALRSFVRLQAPDGTPRAAPPPAGGGLVVGKASPMQGDKPLDVKKLRNGSFGLGDVFLDGPVTLAPDAAPPTGDVSQVATGTTPPAARPRPPKIDLKSVLDRAPGRPIVAENDPHPDVPPPGAGAVAIATRPLPLDGKDFAPVTAMARRLFDLWRHGKLDDSPDAKLLAKGMAALNNYKATAIGGHRMDKYELLLARSPSPQEGHECWSRSQLTSSSVVASLFWLDLLSVNSKISVADFPQSSQVLLLDAAMNPNWTRKCARQAAGAAVSSIYLDEVSRNTSFVRFIARDIDHFDRDISGASIVGDRYILTREGRKLTEGAALDDRDRLVFVGELGAVFESSRGYSMRLFETKIDWLVR